MKRKLIALFAGMTILSAVSANAVTADDNIKILMDGCNVETDVAPIITAESRTIVPIRVISENLGAKVDWDAEEKTVTVEKDDKNLKLAIGEKTIYTNGVASEIDSPAQIINSRTMVPLRVISESLGCEVTWDGEGKTVYITIPEDKVTLPDYVSSGSALNKAIDKAILDEVNVYFEKKALALPIAIIVDTDDSDKNDIKIWGDFWVLNFSVKGDKFFTENGGSFPGCIHLKEENGKYTVVKYEHAVDGEGFNDSILKICEGDEARANKFYSTDEKREEILKELLSEYVNENKLDITMYQDYGWEPVKLDVKKKSSDKPSAKSSGFDVTLPEYFSFSSGAGGWSTELFLNSDGTFTGKYHDSEMGDSGEGYPNGTVYISEFSGKFTNIQKKDDLTYTMTLESLTLKDPENKEKIENDIRFITAEAYGMEKGKEFTLYLPETKTSALSEEFLSWWPGRYDSDADKSVLGCFGLHNKETDYGFFGYTE